MNGRGVTIRKVVHGKKTKLVDMASSANLYLTPQQGELYEAAITRSPLYNEHILKPLYGAEARLPELVATVAGRRPLTIVDCGPGTSDDAALHLSLIAQVATIACYVVVDVNETLLNNVASGVSKMVDARAVRCRFESLNRSTLGIADQSDVLFIVGSTAMNFESGELKRLLSTMTRAGDLVCLQALLRDGVSESHDHVRRYETEDIFAFTFAPLELLGGRRGDFAPHFAWRKGRVEFRFRAQGRSNLSCTECPSLEAGDTVLTGFSRRPSWRDHRRYLDTLFRRSMFVVSDKMVALSIGVA